jgi:CheY-like chemotaxis protein
MTEKKVLFVDDDTDDLQLIQEILRESQPEYKLDEARNGEEALEYLKQSRALNALPCLIVLDINMPVMDGKQALSIIKSTDGLKHIPVIVFTTSKRDADEEFCNSLGAELVTKPQTFVEMKQVLHDFLNSCK